jgi:hypothetical protein
MAQEVSISKVDIPLKRTAGLPPIGIYRCVIRKVDLNDGASGYPYMACECSIDDKKYPDESGSVFYANLSLSPKAKWKMEEALNALGAPTEGRIDSTGWFMGKRFYAMLEHHEWEGRKRLQLDEWIARDLVKERVAAWLQESAKLKAEEKATKVVAEAEAAEMAPDLDDEPEVAEAEVELEPELDEALDDLWDDD